MLEQRIAYLRENPVRGGFGELAETWKYSSVVAYYTRDRKKLLELVSVCINER